MWHSPGELKMLGSVSKDNNHQPEHHSQGISETSSLPSGNLISLFTQRFR